jgi:hypothetical protein
MELPSRQVSIPMQAFVGYRDYPPEQGFGQHVVQDFVSDESNFRWGGLNVA